RAPRPPRSRLLPYTTLFRSDAQLQEAIRQIDTDSQSIVATIDDKTIRESGTGSKSGALAQALESGKLIIVVTIQTFPFILDQLRSEEHTSELQSRFDLVCRL